MLYVTVNNFSVMSGLVSLCWTSIKQWIKCQGHNTIDSTHGESWTSNIFDTQSNAESTEPLHSTIQSTDLEEPSISKKILRLNFYSVVQGVQSFVWLFSLFNLLQNINWIAVSSDFSSKLMFSEKWSEQFEIRSGLTDLSARSGSKLIAKVISRGQKICHRQFKCNRLCKLYKIPYHCSQAFAFRSFSILLECNPNMFYFP